MKKLVFLILTLFLFLHLLSGETIHPKLKNVVEKLKQKAFSEKEINQVFSDPRLEIYRDIPSLRRKKVNYFEKAFGLFNPDSIQQGRNFIKANFEILSRVEKEFDVPKEIIAAILRVESNFGRFLGERVLINTFYSRILLDVKRVEAEEELVQLLVICRQMGLGDVFSLKGSYMGAFGLPQFLPSSFIYALDGNKDGKIDLFSPEDAIFSIANYLKKKGFSNSFYDQIDALKKYNNSDEYVLAVLVYAYFLKV
jgi:membrane-bound lytic murein transglycosylase B